MKAQLSTACPRVLLVEDDLTSAHALSSILRKRGFDVLLAPTLAEGFARLTDNPTHIILDLMLPDGDGTNILRHVRSKTLATKVVVTTAVNDRVRLRTVQDLRPDAVLQKPIDLDRLLRMLEPMH